MFDIGKKVYSRIQSRLKNCFGPFVMPGPIFWLFRHRHIFRLFIFWSKKRFLATRLVYQKLDAGMQICLAYVAFLIRPSSTNENSEIPRTCHSFLSLAPPWCIFCFLSSGFIFHMICGEALTLYQFHVIQRRSYIMEIWWEKLGWYQDLNPWLTDPDVTQYLPQRLRPILAYTLEVLITRRDLAAAAIATVSVTSVQT